MNHNKIKEVCLKYDISNYEIVSGSRVDVFGTVNLDYCGLYELPFKFNEVHGDFTCYGNYLNSLKNSPECVKGTFDCGNNNITNLYYSPDKVESNFYCNNNLITSLKSKDKTIGGDFHCKRNKLTSLLGFPEVGGSIYLNDNDLTSLEGCSMSISGNFDCSTNKLTSLEFSPTMIDGYFTCLFNDNIDYDNIITWIVNNNINLNKLKSDFNSNELYKRVRQTTLKKLINNE